MRDSIKKDGVATAVGKGIICCDFESDRTPNEIGRQSSSSTMRNRLDFVTLKPTVSSDSMLSVSKSSLVVGKQLAPKAIVETAFFLQHQKKQQQPAATITNRKSCLRGTNYCTSDQIFRNELYAQKEAKPPNVIVFINSSVSRQKRRSSKCSQLTMDEEVIQSNYDNDDDIDGDEDLSCASLDIQDVFAETKKEFSQKYGKNSDSMATSSSGLTSSHSNENHNKANSLVKRSPKRQLPIKSKNEPKRIVERQDHFQSKLHKSAQSIFSKRSNASATLLWFQEQDTSNGTTYDNDDEDDDDYEDFAQDSLLVRNTRNQRIVQQQQQLIVAVAADVALSIERNNVNETRRNEMTKSTTATTTTTTNKSNDVVSDPKVALSTTNCYSQDLPSPSQNVICMSRAA
jgi:hypothetical protein